MAAAHKTTLRALQKITSHFRISASGREICTGLTGPGNSARPGGRVGKASILVDRIDFVENPGFWGFVAIRPIAGQVGISTVKILEKIEGPVRVRNPVKTNFSVFIMHS